MSNYTKIQALCNQMIAIPRGEVELRDDRTKETWNIEIKPLLLSKFQVTQDFYFAVTNEDPSTIKGKGYPIEQFMAHIEFSGVVVGLTKNEV